MGAQYNFIFSLLDGNIMNGNRCGHACIPEHKAVAPVKTYIQAAIGAYINDAVVLRIFFHYIDGFVGKVPANLFPAGSVIFAYIEIRSKIVEPVTIE